ncbi:MAG: hypothetical protein AAGG75_07570 [Bacteroidota bacterium]
MKAALSIGQLLLTVLLLFTACQKAEPTLPLPNSRNTGTQANTIDSTGMETWLRQVCAYDHRRAGSANWEAAMQDVEAILREMGYTEIEKNYFDIQYWESTNWSLEVQLGEEWISMPSFFEQGSGLTGPEGLEAELVYVGRQIESEEEVAGKIVVADLEFGTTGATGLPNPVVRPNHLSFPEESILSSGDVYWQAKEAGALGVLFIMAEFHGNVKEYMYIAHDDILRALPAQFVGNRDGIKLRCFAQEGRRARIVQEGIYETRQVYNLWTTLEGSSQQNLIISTHLDSPFRGVIEDGSGIVSVLAQAQAWYDTPLAERKKELYFVFTATHLYKDSPGGAIFSDTYPDIMARSDALIEIEHIGAIQQAVENDDFVNTSALSPIGIYHSEDEGYVTAELMNMIANYPPVGGPINTIETDFPLTEAASWIVTNPDLPYISLITNPTYLLTIDDDFDKIDMGAVVQTNRNLLRLITNYAENL